MGTNYMRLEDTVHFSEVPPPLLGTSHMGYAAVLRDQTFCMWEEDSTGWCYVTQLNEISYRVNLYGRLIKEEYCKDYKGDADTINIQINGVFTQRD